MSIKNDKEPKDHVIDTGNEILFFKYDDEEFFVTTADQAKKIDAAVKPLNLRIQSIMGEGDGPYTVTLVRADMYPLQSCFGKGS